MTTKQDSSFEKRYVINKNKSELQDKDLLPVHSKGKGKHYLQLETKDRYLL